MMIESAAIGHPAYACSLPRRPESAEAARHLVSTALDTWGLPELKDDARLVVTELVSNTVAHARHDTIRVAVTRLNAVLVELSVTDLSMALPRIRRPASADEESGRGLAIVAALTDGRWGTERRRWGKRVWAQLLAPGGRAGV